MTLLEIESEMRVIVEQCAPIDSQVMLNWLTFLSPIWQAGGVKFQGSASLMPPQRDYLYEAIGFLKQAITNANSDERMSLTHQARSCISDYRAANDH